MRQRRKRSSALSILPVVIIILGTVLIVVGTIALLKRQAQSTAVQPINQTQQVIGGEPTYPEIERVSLEDAKTAYDEGKAVFVDVRGETAYEDGHIPGALNIPLSEINTRTGELDPNQWIITYCT